MRYLPKSPSDREAMLKAIGTNSINDLFTPIPPEYRLNRDLKNHRTPRLRDSPVAAVDSDGVASARASRVEIPLSNSLIGSRWGRGAGQAAWSLSATARMSAV